MKTTLLNIILVGSLLSGCVTESKPHPNCYIELKKDGKTHICNTLYLRFLTDNLQCFKQNSKSLQIDLRKDVIREVCVGEGDKNE